MQVGRIPLLVGGVTGFVGLLVPTIASGQLVVDTYVNYEWFNMAQSACVASGATAVDQAIAAFRLDATTRQDAWYALGDADDPVLWVFCIADADNDEIVDDNAKRVLVNITVSGTNSTLAEEIRDYLVTCMDDACPAEAPVTTETITWSGKATAYRGQNGTLLDFICPPRAGESLGAVWGTDVYTDDSSICTAAVHAGVIDADEGGTVTIEIAPGQAAYQGSLRNGIETTDWGSYAGSFRVIVPG